MQESAPTQETAERRGPNGPLVVGFDGSCTAVRALTWAARQARRSGLPLLTVVAWQPTSVASADDRRSQQAQSLAEQARSTLRQLGEPDTGVVVARGSAADVLLAHGHGATAVVVGSRGHLGQVGRALGSVSRAVATQSIVPVVVIGARANVTRPAHPVLSSSSSRLDDATIAWAAERARRAKVALHVVDTYQQHFAVGVTGPQERAREHEAAQRAHEQLLDRIRHHHPDVTVTGELHEGRASDVLTGLLQPDDLLVVGARDEDARPALRTAVCPVVMVPPGRTVDLTARSRLSLPSYAARFLQESR
jgi:nucleotide-binding universal stress UspA family protein